MQWRERIGAYVKGVKRLALAGAGNLLRGDDAAGLLVAMILRNKLRPLNNVLVVPCGVAVENYLGVIKAFSPELTLLVDAVDFGAKAGAVGVFELGEVRCEWRCTHGLPLTLIARILACKVVVLGIQPLYAGVRVGVSEPVRRAILEVTSFLESLFAKSASNSARR